MDLLRLVLCLTLVAPVKTNEWCYTCEDHSPSHWADISGSHCGEQHQSPIDIVTSAVKTDPKLNNFTFVNFDSQSIKTITFNGHSVQCNMEDDKVEVSGGGLSGHYSVKQFHFHWSKDGSGSEHLVDDHRYTMEMHIVTEKKDVEGDVLSHKDGIAVLGFFISATEEKETSEPWQTLTSYLENITAGDSDTAELNHDISLSDLIGHVDLSKFYRYMGSLTTPMCDEAVVWTLFQQPIQVHKDLLQKFPEKTKLSFNYRPSQPLNDRKITASPATPLPEVHPWCYDNHHCDHTPDHWSELPDSNCGGDSQSPIDIETQSATVDEHLTSFNFTNFNNKRAIKSITNTGHTVKCILEDGAVEVSGGGLEHVYSTLEFHFHWGSDAADSHGSEHSVDSQRYPMEMHIVNKRKDLSLEEALQHSDGLAVLGFFIEAPGSSKSSSHSDPAGTEAPTTTDSTGSDMEAWKKLTRYLSAIKNIGSEVEVTEEIAIDELLGSVNRGSYYRYSGSLTTPSCDEAVVWTVFKETVKVDHDLMAMFRKNAGYDDVFRPRQSLHSRKVYATAAATVPGPVLFSLLLPCLCALSA